MSVQACANLVARADPPRFKAAMAAPLACRPVLLALYAANVEISRAPWVTQEHLIAEMRLQWWRDVFDELAQGTPRRHDVVDALRPVFDRVPTTHMQAAIDARQWDIYKEPHATLDAALDYCRATTAGAMITGFLALGGGTRHVPTLLDLAGAAGFARFINSARALMGHGVAAPLAVHIYPDLRDALVQHYQTYQAALSQFRGRAPSHAVLIELAGTGRVFKHLLRQGDLTNPPPLTAPLATAWDRMWLARRVIAP